MVLAFLLLLVCVCDAFLFCVGVGAVGVVGGVTLSYGLRLEVKLTRELLRRDLVAFGVVAVAEFFFGIVLFIFFVCCKRASSSWNLMLQPHKLYA